jgi:ferrous iron transport protein B
MVGTPNVGKTSLINAVSGSRLEIGNWPGTTLEVASATARLGCGPVELVDLPGAYTLAGSAPDEEVLLPALEQDEGALVVNVVDATHLARDLTLTLELAELGRPMVVALNLVDQAAQRGVQVDPRALEAELGVPVVTVRAHTGGGVDELVAAAGRAAVAGIRVRYAPPVEAAAGRLQAHLASRWHALATLTGDLDAAVAPAVAVPAARAAGVALPMAPGAGGSVPFDAARVDAERNALLGAGVDAFLDVGEGRHRLASRLADVASRPLAHGDDPGDRIDRALLHPLIGPFALVGGLALTFHLTFALSDPWVGFLGVVQGVLAGWVEALPLPALLASFLSGAVIEGVGTVVAFVPVLFTLYALLGFLENAGLLARVAYLADGLMRRLGLPGRAVLPMVLSLGCTVPAVQSVRMLDEPRDRLRVALAIPSIPCGARLPVFVLLAAAFVPRYAGLVLTGLYLAGFVVAILSAFLFRRVLPGEAASGAMELPAYRLPPMRLVLRLAWLRTKAFLQGAGGPILVVVALVWALLAFTLPSGVSVFEAVARSLAPLFAPIGLGDWRVVGALIPGTVAKEVMIGSLALTFTGAEASVPLGFLAGLREVAVGLFDAVRGTLTGLWGSVLAAEAPDGALGSRLGTALPLASGLSLMVFSLLYVPCVATLSAIAKLFGRRWALVSIAWQLTVAYVAAGAVFLLFA